MFKRSTLLFCIFFCVASFGTLLLKVYVQNLGTDVTNLEDERNKLNNDIRVLKAEWSYLNNAERVSMLAKKYLDLNSVGTQHVKYVNKKNSEIKESVDELSKDVRKVNLNWKYKSRMGILKISNNKSH